MERYDIKQQKNFHDYFIIFIVAAAIVGTAQMGLLIITLCAGLLCLPAAMKEIYISIKEKAQPIIAFMILFLLYTVVSVAWAPRHENLLRELWNISWNIIYNNSIIH